MSKKKATTKPFHYSKQKVPKDISVSVSATEHNIVHKKRVTADEKQKPKAVDHASDLKTIIKKTEKAVYGVKKREQKRSEKVPEGMKKTREHLKEALEKNTNKITNVKQKPKKTKNKLVVAANDFEEQAKIFEGFFASTITPLVLLDKDFNFIQVNKAYAKIWHRDTSYFTGKNRFVLDPSGAVVLPIFEEVVRTKMPYKAIEFPFSLADHPEWGETYWNWSLTPILNKKGEVEFLLLSSEDVTERKKAEEAVKGERQRLYDVLETLPVYVVLLTRDYHVPFANRFFRERFGESGGKRCFEYLFNRTEPCKVCETYSVMKTNAPHHWEWTGPDSRIYDIYDFPFIDLDGSPLIMEMGIDITERKQAEAALREMNQTLEQRVAERTERIRRLASYPKLNPNPVMEVGASGELTFCNPAAYKILDELTMARKDWGALLPEDLDAVFRDWDKKTPAVLVREVIVKDRILGETIQLVPEFKVARIYARDITEHKCAEDRAARLTRLYAVLSLVNETIVRTRDEELLFREICRIVAEDGKFPLVWIGIIKEHDVVPVASCGPATDYLQEIKVKVIGKLGKGPTGTAIRENRSVVNDDFGINPSTSPWREAALYYGFHASAAFPLRRHDKAVGAFTVYAHAPNAFDAEQVSLLESLAADISFALDAFEQERLRVRVEEKLVKAKKEWERTFASVPDMIAILDNRHRVLQVNEAMALRFGVKPEKFIGLPCYKAVHGLSAPPAFCPHMRTMKDKKQHTEEVHEDRLGGDFEVTTMPIYDDQDNMVGSVHIAHDITEHKRAEKEQQTATEFLRLINDSKNRDEMIRNAATFFQEQSGCEAVGIRLKEGDDYPYYETRGFPPEFVLLENRLCAIDEGGCVVHDSAGYPIMECMCGNVIQGRFDPSKPFFTSKGSFYSNCTTELIATTTEADRQARTRNRCNGEGYESVALIALRIGEESLGLLQLNDTNKGRFTPKGIVFWERLAGYLAVALAKFEAEEALKKAHDELEKRVQERTAELSEAYETLTVEMEERKKAEQALRQSHKMQAIGTLAGGIAHDFNNIIAGIIGFTEMALEDIPVENPTHRRLELVLKGAHRGRDLVKQILAFSRKGEHEKKPVSMGHIFNDALPLIRASLPSTIEIRKNILTKHDIISADQTQIHQVILNLCANAAYAMRDNGGVLEIILADENISPDEHHFNHGLEPGPYIRLTISDTGCGMEPEVLESIFDPFFTTKPTGEGTGLGLSVVHGIVKSHDGNIRVYSKPGQGSSFNIFIPKIESDSADEVKHAESIQGGKESILVVDDEDLLIEMSKQRLERLGYTIVGSTSSVEALEAFRDEPNKFDLVVTDYTMPHMTGLELARELLRIRPDLSIIMCSGLNEPVPTEKIREAGIQEFFVKPIGKNEFAQIIRRVLDRDR